MTTDNSNDRQVLITVATEQGEVLESLSISDPEDLLVLDLLLTATAVDYLNGDDD